jgi:hypothetical protein
VRGHFALPTRFQKLDGGSHQHFFPFFNKTEKKAGRYFFWRGHFAPLIQKLDEGSHQHIFSIFQNGEKGGALFFIKEDKILPKLYIRFLSRKQYLV